MACWLDIARVPFEVKDGAFVEDTGSFFPCQGVKEVRSHNLSIFKRSVGTSNGFTHLRFIMLIVCELSFAASS